MSFESENKNVEKIIVSNKTYYLVGTSHISENSVKLVKEVIERVQPDTVSIELDKKRYEKYTNSNQWGNTDIIKIIKEKKLVVLISNIVYSAYQKKLANTKGTTQAGELIQAIKSAKEIGANIQLIDRDIQVTFKRMWRHLSFLEKPNFIEMR
ncbi:TraB domain-containing protein [Enterococcus faecalis]|nr:TraB domain-containing protein [Enterococcus faecalis]MDK4459385.1 TraB domain-containing protein [Enterococcus faecalis]